MATNGRGDRPRDPAPKLPLGKVVWPVLAATTALVVAGAGLGMDAMKRLQRVRHRHAETHGLAAAPVIDAVPHATTGDRLIPVSQVDWPEQPAAADDATVEPLPVPLIGEVMRIHGIAPRSIGISVAELTGPTMVVLIPGEDSEQAQKMGIELTVDAEHEVVDLRVIRRRGQLPRTIGVAAVYTVDNPAHPAGLQEGRVYWTVRG